MGWNEQNWDTLEALLEWRPKGEDTSDFVVSQASSGEAAGPVKFDATKPGSAPFIIPGFGIHPWAVERTLASAPPDTLSAVGTTDGPFTISTALQEKLEALPWFGRLTDLLRRYPQAIVGEIGLDKVTRNRTTGEIYSFQNQTILFRLQWDLAIRLRRPVSVHAVKCPTQLLDFIRGQVRSYTQSKKAAVRKMGNKGGSVADSVVATDPGSLVDSPELTDPLPPKIMFHSFTGAVELVQQLLRLPSEFGTRFYYSFSQTINQRSTKLPAIVAAIPENRLLMETDLSDATQIDGAMLAMAQTLADLKGYSLGDTIQLLHHNSMEFYHDQIRTLPDYIKQGD
ncbi:TatD family [Dimargaris cristalligena]|uniref:TatD family n=1 Tax=Dimargaris cristalligena TaxID=215637 RepID=A0A4P9ZT40_9FUNG|nr:TatD family [Dimargaris cristalligena]|eukprot:RKP36756.1 TatD family [Dimargaris cristalligena]